MSEPLVSEQDLLFHLRATLTISSNPSALRKVRSHFGSFLPLFAPGAAVSELLGAANAQKLFSSETEEKAKRELDLARNHGIAYIPYSSPVYPEALKNIPDPPPGLYVRWNLRDGDDNALAVVGSKYATPYGLNLAEVLSRELAGRGVIVVSGLARGVDSFAHRGALSSGARTIAVIGSGLLEIYPKENQKLSEEIAGQGALLSEFPLETPPFKGNFPQRNRIISGITLGTLLIEAPEDSGALITAASALDQNREVLVCPGRARDVKCAGTNKLLKEGAAPVETAEDVFRAVPRLLQKGGQINLFPGADGKKAVPDQGAQVGEKGKKILDALSDMDPLGIDDLVGKTGLSSQAVLAELTLLELSGRVRQLPGKRFIRPIA